MMTNPYALHAALIAALSIQTLATVGSPAQAAQPSSIRELEAYAGTRVDGAFQLIATMPAVASLALPLARKGDLPAQAGCSGPGVERSPPCRGARFGTSAVVETQRGIRSSTLLRLDPLTVAGRQGLPRD